MVEATRIHADAGGVWPLPSREAQLCPLANETSQLCMLTPCSPCEGSGRVITLT